MNFRDAMIQMNNNEKDFPFVHMTEGGKVKVASLGPMERFIDDGILFIECEDAKTDIWMFSDRGMANLFSMINKDHILKQ